jgi:two-component system, chemotaxis family, chemotaxis protein CheY
MAVDLTKPVLVVDDYNTMIRIMHNLLKQPMTGFALLKEMRSDPSLAEIPFIMVTAESKTENVVAAKRAGVSNYIVKPFNAQTLKTKIDAVFGEEQIPVPAA